MTASAPSRGPITTRILAELGTAGFPVGDNSSPTTPYGWQGEPDSPDARFIPYLSLTPSGSGQQRFQDLANSGADWAFTYTVWYAGVSRKQTEALADRLRDALVKITREVLTTPSGSWKIQQLRCTAIGANNRVGSTYPDYFTQADTFEVWVSKERS